MDYLAIVETETDDKPKRQGFREIEQIDLATGWRQIVAGQWRGIGILDVMEEGRNVLGRKITIAAPGANRGKLQEYYPNVMILAPQEFRDIIEHWPDSERLVMAKRMFSGEILEQGGKSA